MSSKAFGLTAYYDAMIAIGLIKTQNRLSRKNIWKKITKLDMGKIRISKFNICKRL